MVTLIKYQGTTPGSPPSVQALVGKTVALPCDLTPSTPNDSVVLVVWYKDEHTPIYSYDVRGPYITRPKHWRGENLEARALFQRITNPSSLNMDNVSEADEGEYRCRIDYLKSPTKNLRVRLDVIVPPNKPKIYDVNGTEVGDHAGPYEEGGDMKLQCVVSGGKPTPTIRWWREDKLIQTSTTTRNRDLTNRLANQLIVRGLKRTDQHVKFTCEASNHNYSLPVRSSTSIDIYFRPLDVEILSSNQPFSADRKYEIPCQTFGSRPPANITWSILEMRRELRPPKYNITENIAEDRNSTSSLLTFIPSKEDNGRTLVCRASNLNVKNGVIETSLQLNVYYIPRIQLLLGSSLNPDDIEEGDDVYFECQVDANPSAYKVVWKHNGIALQKNQLRGIIMSNENLALQAVTRSQAGNYSCVGSNVEGDGDSNIIHLKIMFKPICRTHQKRVYGIARHEESRILCEVESYPPPDRFSWSFNNSAEVMEVPQERYNSTIHHFTSILTYTPVTELDYGTVMCWGNNLAGRQQEPCIFHIIAAGKPDPLYNCSIVNRTNDSLEVECTEGFDGGQPQYFLLEVYERKSGVLQANVSAKFPLFIVSGLDPGKELKMAVYAANAKGRSEPVLLEGFTLKVAEKQTVLSLGTRDQIEIAPVLGVLVGIVTAVLLVTVVILLALKIRRSRRNACRALRPRFLPVKDKVTLPLRSESEDLFEKDDKNPDVVPSNKDSDYQLGSAAQTPGLNNSALSVSGNPADFGRNVAGSPPASAATSPSAPLQNVTPLAEAYMARNRNFTPSATNNEVVYAELQLARPNSLDPIKNGGQHFASGQQYATLRKGDDSTIYTQIDHGRRPPPPPVPNSRTSPIVSPVTAAISTSKQGLYHREVVTVRTPLMGCQQESCV
ncbi:LOW QUALITY PROTEIN: nephrin-like [Sitophilus oryzae]|uniref:LOW QUALITY PROTEIN: nephrin-like n=1 Tax=Sitophilus oryzae TaxID=7048 RepID=A0A6J2YKR5_SITOR|nr:LOW QUALITY PROTEIN: nephrin-like [Sitophilus oryzae]